MTKTELDELARLLATFRHDCCPSYHSADAVSDVEELVRTVSSTTATSDLRSLFS